MLSNCLVDSGVLVILIAVGVAFLMSLIFNLMLFTKSGLHVFCFNDEHSQPKQVKPKVQDEEKNKKSETSTLFLLIGLILICISIVIFLFTFAAKS